MLDAGVAEKPIKTVDSRSAFNYAYPCYQPIVSDHILYNIVDMSLGVSIKMRDPQNGHYLVPDSSRDTHPSLSVIYCKVSRLIS